MQEINLLQNKLKDNTANWEKGGRIVTILLVFFFIAEIVLVALFYMLNKNTQENIVSLKNDNTKIQTDLNNTNSDTLQATGFQAQAKNLNTLLSTHVIWNKIINDMSVSAYKNNQYMSVNASTAGVINIEGHTDSYTDLGKAILALEGSKAFSSVRLLTTSPSTGQSSGVSYSIELRVSPDKFINK